MCVMAEIMSREALRARSDLLSEKEDICGVAGFQDFGMTVAPISCPRMRGSMNFRMLDGRDFGIQYSILMILTMRLRVY
jgi:hypothetical protein